MFFTDTKDFTHVGKFYFIPVYLNLDTEIPTISGTNKVYDFLFGIMAIIHNTVIEFTMQVLARIFDYPHEPNFPFHITGELQK